MTDAKLSPASRASIIRDLNDRFRRGDPLVPGRTVMTAGVNVLVEGRPQSLSKLVVAVRAFDSFDGDNDPHGEHDFGAFEFAGERLFWKIDYSAPDFEYGSDDPADLPKTVRVLTLLLAEEY